LESQILPASKAAKTRYIWTDSHQLIPAPSSIKDMLKAVPPLTKPLLAAVLTELLAKRQLKSDESIYDFFFRRFGSEVCFCVLIVVWYIQYDEYLMNVLYATPHNWQLFNKPYMANASIGLKLYLSFTKSYNCSY